MVGSQTYFLELDERHFEKAWLKKNPLSMQEVGSAETLLGQKILMATTTVVLPGKFQQFKGAWKAAVIGSQELGHIQAATHDMGYIYRCF